jgi:CheY-like chemotaxis protein
MFIVKKVLQNNRAEVVEAENGLVALEKLRQNTSIDVVLMDLNMPVMNGFEASKYIRNELELNIPIIAITAYSRHDTYEKCIEYGMSDLINKASLFSKFCVKWLKENNHFAVRVFDFGCGNGRDTKYWSKKNFSVTGIDQSMRDCSGNNWNIKNSDIIDFLDSNKCYKTDITYCRFFLHALEFEKINKLLKWTKGLFMAEFRIEGDEPVLYKEHKRNFVVPRQLQLELLKNSFDILYYIQGYDMAKYKDENPLVGRIIARKLMEE